MTTIPAIEPTVSNTTYNQGDNSSRFRVITSFIRESSIFQRIIATVVLTATAYIAMKVYSNSSKGNEIETLKKKYMQTMEEIRSISQQIKKATRLTPGQEQLIIEQEITKCQEAHELAIKILQKPAIYTNIDPLLDFVRISSLVATSTSQRAVKFKKLDTQHVLEAIQENHSLISEQTRQQEEIIKEHLRLLVEQRNQAINRENLYTTFLQALEIEKQIVESNALTPANIFSFAGPIIIFLGRIEAIINAPAQINFPSISDEKETKEFRRVKEDTDTTKNMIMATSNALAKNQGNPQQIKAMKAMLENYCKNTRKLFELGTKACKLRWPEKFTPAC